MERMGTFEGAWQHIGSFCFGLSMSSKGPVHRIQYACIADTRKIKYEVGEKKKCRPLAEKVLAQSALEVRKSYLDEKEGITVNYISEGSRIWLNVADRGLNTRVAFAYLEYVKRRSPEGGGRTGEDSLTPLMASQLNTYTSDTDRIAQINNEIAAIKEVMLENMEVVLRRGEKLEDLTERSENLAVNAKLFNRNASKLKNHFRWANLRWYILGFFVLCLIAVGITWGFCGLTFQNCRKK